MEALGWYLYDFASEMIIAVPKWKDDWCKRGRHGDELHGTVHSKVKPRYVVELRDSGIKRDFAEAIRNRFKREGVDLRVVSSIEELRATVHDIADRREKALVEPGDADDG